MWLTKFAPLALLGACAAHAPAISQEPGARVAWRDLALESPAGRAALRQRVADAALGYCREHEDEVTPDALRNDGFHCLETLRSAILAEMPADIRKAYARALMEAGIRGRRL
ncbi:UrcA family protein [Sphingomonas sp. G-3-2-10]|uniref:UrcA family protein n=1 Tax=Sphingomonas sp. G-3-2-10 TaxID=2728838 RepID=UPI00146A1A06|nr:UrcA family protein [Sphingomonas sp. G-3-2-10]NML07532.1 UrcA family protein [Sphingomonas sp. G-3-2-10]